MIEKSRILLIVDGAASMAYALPLLDRLTSMEIRVFVAPTAYDGGALSFTTEMALSAISGAPCVDIATLTPAEVASYDAVVLAPVSLGVLRVFSQGRGLEVLKDVKSGVLVVPAMLVEDDVNKADFAELFNAFPPESRILYPDGDILSLGRLGELHVASCKRCANELALMVGNGDLQKHCVLITAGPTIEDIDPARFISNRSTGKMGIALAEAAARRGARVILVAGPVRAPLPRMSNIQIVNVRSASDMNQAVLDNIGMATIAVLCAAVADFTPNVYVEHKIKKGKEDNLTLLLKRTPDILAGIGARQHKPYLVGFAAESEELNLNAIQKLQKKHCDMLCANDITRPGAGFASDTNQLTLYFKDGKRKTLDMMPKTILANQVFDEVIRCLDAQNP